MEKLRPCIAEFIGTFALIFVGIGAIKTAGHDVLAVALAHGLTIAAFVSATMHISGGHLWPRRHRELLESALRLLDRAFPWRRRRRTGLPALHFRKENKPSHAGGRLTLAQCLDRKRREKSFRFVYLQDRSGQVSREKA